MGERGCGYGYGDGSGSRSGSKSGYGYGFVCLGARVRKWTMKEKRVNMSAVETTAWMDCWERYSVPNEVGWKGKRMTA